MTDGCGAGGAGVAGAAGMPLTKKSAIAIRYSGHTQM